LAAIVGSSSDAIIGKTLEGIITSWNAGAERMYGYGAAEVLGRSVALLVPPEGPQDQPGILARIRDGERIPPYETVRQRRDGTRLVVSLSVSPIRDGEGAIVGASAIARDVTDLKRAEEELRAAHRQTVEILESIGDAFYAVDDAWRFTHVNRRAEELWRIDRDALLGKNLWEEFSQSAGTHLHEEMLRAMAERRPAAFEMFSPVLSRWIEVNLYPAAAGLSVYVRDVTDQKEAREEKARLLEEVANSAARQRAFLRDVLASVTEGGCAWWNAPRSCPRVWSRWGSR
jgi:PAS domain S-box-containing protein